MVLVGDVSNCYNDFHIMTREIIREGDSWRTIRTLGDFFDWLSVRGRFAPSLVRDWKEIIMDRDMEEEAADWFDGMGGHE